VLDMPRLGEVAAYTVDESAQKITSSDINPVFLTIFIKFFLLSNI
jgi:hypothetical protein